MTRDRVYLKHILDAIEKIESYTSVGREQYMSASHWQDEVLSPFFNCPLVIELSQLEQDLPQQEKL